MRRLRSPRPLVGLALASIAVAAAACGQGTAVGTSSTSATTTTTTTTLPVPIPIYGTMASGLAQFEGKVKRVPVPLLGAGKTQLPPPSPAQKISSGTVKIAFRQFGSGPSLVLVGGQHSSMSWWDPQLLSQLAASYQVTIFDFPSIGYSAPLSRAPSVENYGDALAGLIAALGLSNVTIAGWGMGGEAALSAVERHPGIAIGLVLIDTTMGGTLASTPEHAAALTISQPDATAAELADLLFPSTSAGDHARATWLADVATLQPDVVTMPALAAQARAQAAFLKSDRVARAIGRIRIPTLVVAGAHDALFPVADSRALVAAITHARLVVYPNAGYGALFEDRATFVTDLATFMAHVTTTTTTTTTIP